MCEIENIAFLIRDIIRVNERIVSQYDSKLLCSDFENTRNELKKLFTKKQELIESLVTSMNEFFEIKENFITKRLKVTRFALVPSLVDHKFRFLLPKTVDRTSRQYFCYISLMDRLVKQYDVITCERDGYHITDITMHLNAEKLFEGD